MAFGSDRRMSSLSTASQALSLRASSTAVFHPWYREGPRGHDLNRRFSEAKEILNGFNVGFEIYREENFVNRSVPLYLVDERYEKFRIPHGWNCHPHRTIVDHSDQPTTQREVGPGPDRRHYSSHRSQPRRHTGGKEDACCREQLPLDGCLGLPTDPRAVLVRRLGRSVGLG